RVRRLRVGAARHRRARAADHAPSAEGDPGRLLRRAVDRRELQREVEVPRDAKAERRAPDREGGRRAAIDDALAGAGGPVKENDVGAGHAPPSKGNIHIFDTTLRDGEQSPGFGMGAEAKLQVAHQLARLGVDVVEAGFPVSSPGDFESCRRIARSVEGPVITALARAVRPDIDAVWGAIRDAERPQIHIVLSVSDIHIQRKLGLSRQAVLRRGADAVAYARSLCDEVQYSPEDSGRADRDYLVETVERMLDAGATVVNIPDTTGYCLPWEFADLVAHVIGHVRAPERALFSVHCHNDLGLAPANSLAAVMAGARRIECTINGIGALA